jgi:hypothetical protein
MPKEKLHHEQRIMERRLHIVNEDEERRVAEDQAEQHRIVVEHNYHLHAQLFRDKYYVPEPAPTPSTPTQTTSESSSASSSATATPVSAPDAPFSESGAEAAQEAVEVKAAPAEFLMFAK